MSWEDGDGGRFPPAPERGLDVARRWIYMHPLATEAQVGEMAFKIELGWSTPREIAKLAMMAVLVRA